MNQERSSREREESERVVLGARGDEPISCAPTAPCAPIRPRPPAETRPLDRERRLDRSAELAERVTPIDDVDAVSVDLEAASVETETIERGTFERLIGHARRAPEERPAEHAQALREHALGKVVEADMLQAAIDALREEAAALRAQAAEQLAALPHGASAADKEAGWALDDRAADLDKQAEALEVEQELSLIRAVAMFADLPEAKGRLADLARRQHERAEALHDPLGAARAEARLRAWDQGAHAAYLDGQGALTLVTVPGGAEVRIFRYVERGRRLALELYRTLLLTPISAMPLPRGSYLIELRCRGCAPVSYPVHIGRNEHWDTVKPGQIDPTPVYLPALGEIDDDEVYVPAGPFCAGGDAQAINAGSRCRLWVDDFAISRAPVTNAQYLAFLNDLIDLGREDAALLHAPRAGLFGEGDPGALLYGLDARGRFTLERSSAERPWLPDEPVRMIRWGGAAAYAAWLAEVTGKPYRLPGEIEWEKAARGVDGRFFPWGNRIDASFCCIEESRSAPQIELSGAHPIDESPYGARGMGGNVRDFCADRYAPSIAGGPPTAGGPRTALANRGGPRVVRGGAYELPARAARSAGRGVVHAHERSPWIGFRVARSLHVWDEGSIG